MATVKAHRGFYHDAIFIKRNKLRGAALGGEGESTPGCRSAGLPEAGHNVKERIL